MKQIDINRLVEGNGLTLERRMFGMEFIKVGDKYMIKNSNGIIVSEKEKAKLERDELVFEDIKADCAKKITPKLVKKQKEVEKLENIEKAESTKE
jgi:hypothetical protein